MEKLSISGEIRSVYSLYELTTSIVSVIKKNYTSSYWIMAELAKLNYYPKTGHCYPDLVDKDEGKIKAQLRSIIWSKDFDRIKINFTKITGENIQDGMKILLRAKLIFDSVHGLSLNILDIEPSFTLGEMAKEKKETINILKLEGIFNKNKFLKLPLLPQRLAIISVDTSKGLADFTSKINEYKQIFNFFYKLYPSILQGDAAVNSIYNQLQLIKKARKYFDLVLIIRGGGGDIGLSCYDNIVIAREIANFPLPVITGIGHSTNETVTEMVAFKNLITPTDVAFFLLGMFSSYSQRTEDSVKKIIINSINKIKDTKKKTNELTQLITSNTQRFIQKESSIIEMIKMQSISATRKNLQHKYFSLNEFEEIVNKTPHKIIRSNSLILLELSKDLKISINELLKNKYSDLEHINDKCRLLDPINILKRGYSITYYNGKPIKTSEIVKDGEKIKTILMKGELTSIINKKNNYDEKN